MLRVPLLAAALLLLVPATAPAHGLGGEAANTSTVGFVALGVEHMLLGWDHLAFIAGIVLLAGRFDRAAKLISTFVIGHSTTLIIASLADLRLSPTAVDVVIALSVVTVGVLGLRGRPQNWTPIYAIVGGFGLIHGFGLATRLLDLGLPDDGLLAKVIAFNIGLEIGQIFAISVIVGVVYLSAKALEGRWNGVRRGAYGVLTAVGLIAAVVLAFPGTDDPAPEAVSADTPAAQGASPAAVACTQIDVQPPGGFAGKHPEKQFYDRGEPAPAEDFNHVIGDGYVIVRYAPDLPDQQVTELRTIIDAKNPSVVAGEDTEQAEPLKAYTAFRELTCERFDAGALQKFTSTWQADLKAGKFG